MANPYREELPIDKTELEKTRIRENEETKRRNYAEKEETRRVFIKNWDTSGYIAPRISLVIAAVIIAGIANNFGGGYVAHKYPVNDGPLNCVESIEIVADGYKKECKNGTIETEKLNDSKVIVKCRCYKNRTNQ